MIERGGKSEERLYIWDDKFDCGDDICIVRKTDMPDLENIIARHEARYYLVASFCRPGMKVLDFPCGSGYGSEIINDFDVEYEGRDNDAPSIEYAKLHYCGEFSVDDLKSPHFVDRTYDVICCVEGIEHIDHLYQSRLVKYFYEALIHGGTLIVTTPEKGEGVNPHHSHEMNRTEFEALLHEAFIDVQMIIRSDVNHKQEKTNFMTAICRKED